MGLRMLNYQLVEETSRFVCIGSISDRHLELDHGIIDAWITNIIIVSNHAVEIVHPLW